MVDNIWKFFGILAGVLLISVSVSPVFADTRYASYPDFEHDTPYPPKNPDPENGSTGVDVNIALSWDGGDPDIEEDVYYDVYIGTASNPPFRERIGPFPATQSRIVYNNLTKLVYNTRYYWRIDAIDSYGYTTTGSVWFFETRDDNTPYIPSNPAPANGSVDVPLNVELEWSGGDPDEGDIVYYDVYLGTTMNPPKIADHITENSCMVTNLLPNTTYYWRIDAFDDYGYTTTGPTWNFKTKDVPVLNIKGVQGGFGKIKVTIENTGNVDAVDMNYSIDVSGGILISGGTTSGVIPVLQSGDEVAVQSNFILGLGRININISVSAQGTPVVNKSYSGFVLLFYIMIT